jgi:hypothetical protein
MDVALDGDDKDRLYQLGYRVKSAGSLGWWATNPDGYSVVRGPIPSEDEAWEICRQHYTRYNNREG